MHWRGILIWNRKNKLCYIKIWRGLILEIDFEKPLTKLVSIKENVKVYCSNSSKNIYQAGLGAMASVSVYKGEITITSAKIF